MDEAYKGVPTTVVKPVFQAARALRFSQPAVSDVVRRSNTALDAEIVSAILEGALRLLPPDNTPYGQEKRRRQMMLKAAHALDAETNFVALVRRLHFDLLDERQQSDRIKAAIEEGIKDIVRLTPDVLFIRPARIFGSLCHWLEYKNTFGFKSNPFLHRKHKAQLCRYVAAFGPGLVVYKLGHEENLFSVEGVQFCREREVLMWIESEVTAR